MPSDLDPRPSRRAVASTSKPRATVAPGASPINSWISARRKTGAEKEAIKRGGIPEEWIYAILDQIRVAPFRPAEPRSAIAGPE
jgi:hypothetical protein